MKLFRKIGLILLTGVLFFYVGYSLIKGTYSTEDEVPANSAFDDINFYKCVVYAYNKKNNTSLSYTVNLSDEQLKTITELDCRSKKIVSSKGLEKLTSLTYLNVNDNKLTSLDVSKNVALTDLRVSDNQLTNLDVSQNPALTKLHAGRNQLTSLDVSKNVALKILLVDSNQLTSLDVSQNPVLETLYVHNNQLTYPSASKNQLTSLDVSKNVALKTLWVYNNQLTSLDVNGATSLEDLWVSGNQLTSLDVSQNPALTYLDVYYNKLTSLDVSRNVALEELYVYNNQLTSLDVSRNVSLKTLSVRSNQLTSLDVSQNQALEKLHVSDNQLTSLDVSQNPALTDLRVYDNQLTSMDVSQNPALYKLDVSKNQLTSMDVSQNPKLWSLSVSFNQLTSLDVSQNPALTYLDVYYNKLTSLDVSQNPALWGVSAYNNQLTSLDLSQNLELNSFFVFIHNNPYREVLYVYKGNDIVVGNNVKIPSHLGWSNPSWSSTNINIAMVDNNGIVTTLESGSVKIEGTVTEKYTTTSTVNVVEITSDKYEINEDSNYIFIGSDNDVDIIKSNINVSDTNVNVDVDLDNYKLYVKYEDEVLKEFNLIGYTSLIYDLSKDYIYIGTKELNLEKINVVNCTKAVSDNKLLIKFEDELVKEYKLISISSSVYDLNKDYIYVGSGKLDISDITVSNNGSVLEKDNKVLIKYNNEVFREYELVSISSDVYDLSKDYIYIGTKDINVNNVVSVNAILNVENDKLLIKYNEDVLDEYKLLSIKFNNYQVFGNSITNVNDDNYEDFISNIVCSDGITYKLFDGEDEVTSGIVSSGMKLDIYYNGNKIYEYIISDEYLTLDESLNVDDSDMVIGRIDVNTSVDTILGKVNTSGEFSILDKNDNAIGSGGSLKTGDKFIVTFPNQVLTYKFSIIGDVTGSGIMNNDDIILTSKHIIKGNLLIDAEYLKAADYDNNNVIDINDVIKMARKVRDSGDINE